MQANDDVQQTPSDPSVKWAEALVEGRGSGSSGELVSFARCSI